MECQTTIGIPGGPEMAAVGLDNRPGNGQPHTHPLRFACEECVEDVFQVFFGKAGAGVMHSDFGVIFIDTRAGNIDLAARGCC